MPRRSRQFRQRRSQKNLRRLSVESLESRRLLAVVSGSVFYDINGNGVADAGESGKADVEVVLKDTTGNIVNGPLATADGTNGPLGSYFFSNVPDGDYQVALQLAADQLQSSPGRVTSPERLGMVLDRHDSPLAPLVDDPTPIGITSVGNELWIANKQGTDGSAADKSILSWDGTTWQHEFTAAGTDSVYDLTFDGTYLWAADSGGNQIVQYDLTGTRLASYTANTIDDFVELHGIAWDGSDFWVIESKYDGTNDVFSLQRWAIDSQAGTVNVLDDIALNVERPLGLDYHDGLLWTTSSSPTSTERIYAVDIGASVGGSAAIAKSFPAPAANQNLPSGVTVADGSLWISQYYDNQILELDLGAPEPRQVTVAGADIAVDGFGVSTYGQISATVYQDFDQDGTKDMSEGGIEGWRVYLDQNGNGQLETYEPQGQSDENGQVQFDQVLPGEHSVRLQARAPGWTISGAADTDVTVLAESTTNIDLAVLQDGFGPVGAETLVNVTVDGYQGDPYHRSGVAVNSNGYSAVAFGEIVGQDEIYLRIFDPNGHAVTGEVAVDTTTSSRQRNPIVSEIPGTELFVVGWEAGNGRIRIYDQQGNPQTDPIAITSKHGRTSIVDIDANSSGEIAVLYNEISESGPGNVSINYVIHVQRFDVNGNKLGKAIEIADPTVTPTQSNVALAEDGGFVVAWRQSSGEILAQRYDANGRAIGNEIVVQSLTGVVSTPQLAMGPTGDFVIAWTEGTGAPLDVKMKYYSADGSPLGTVLELSLDTTNYSKLAMSMSPDGIIALTSQEFSPFDIVAQRFRFDEATGHFESLDDSRFVANATTAGTQERPNVAYGPDGQMWVVWNGYGPGDGEGVFLQRFAARAGNQAPVVSITSPADAAVVSGSSIVIDAVASDVDGSVSQVEFFVAGSPIGTDSDGSDGWSLTWDSTTVSDGSQTITATAIDDTGESASDAITISVDNGQAHQTMFVGDLDGTAVSAGKNWRAEVTITVIDQDGNPVEGAGVSGDWTGGSSGNSTGITGANGQLTVTSNNIRKKIDSTSWTVINITHGTLSYDPSLNTDPDGDSSGTSITVFKDGTTAAGQALTAAGGDHNFVGRQVLTLASAEAALFQAVAWWSGRSGQELSTPIHVVAADLAPGQLGWAEGTTITLDMDTAWRLPGHHETGGYDLFTAVAHEVGHILGFGHDDRGLMSPALTAGAVRSTVMPPHYDVLAAADPALNSIEPTPLRYGKPLLAEDAVSDAGRQLVDLLLPAEQDRVSGSDRRSLMIDDKSKTKSSEADNWDSRVDDLFAAVSSDDLFAL